MYSDRSNESLTKSLQVEKPPVVAGAELHPPWRDVRVDQLVAVEDDRLGTPSIDTTQKKRRSPGKGNNENARRTKPAGVQNSGPAM